LSDIKYWFLLPFAQVPQDTEKPVSFDYNFEFPIKCISQKQKDCKQANVKLNNTRKIKMILRIIIVFSCFLSLGLSESESIPVCPAAHDRAFDGGRKCCHYSEDYKSSKDVAPRESDVCPSNDCVECPHGDGCEDSPPSCFNNFELEGFGEDYDGFYLWGNDQYENSKQIYVLQSKALQPLDKCVWWFLEYRQWILGDCEDVGSNVGFAYIDADVQCPHPEEERWKSTVTGAYLEGIKNYSADRCKSNEDGTAVCGASSVPPLEASATVGVGVTVKEGQFVQSCKWRFIRRQWRCV